VAVEVGIFGVFAWHVELHSLDSQTPPKPPEMAIAVQPVIDDVPLLKLGSKPQKYKLPEMWKKPDPVKRYEDKSAPTVDAQKNPEKLPENEVAQADEAPAPEDAELAKEVDEDIPEVDEKKEEPNLQEEGAADGVREGTETDPLKAFVISQYRIKIIGWFKAGFSPPSQIDCETAAGLRTKVVAQIGSDRSVVSYTLSSASGNAIFDSRVSSHMDRKKGQQLPPPPPNYADILDSVVNLNFSGELPNCKRSGLPDTTKNDPAEAPAAPPTDGDSNDGN
jgi:hypothetical protein